MYRVNYGGNTNEEDISHVCGEYLTKK